jgi:hypothetical protein
MNKSRVRDVMHLVVYHFVTKSHDGTSEYRINHVCVRCCMAEMHNISDVPCLKSVWGKKGNRTLERVGLQSSVNPMGFEPGLKLTHHTSLSVRTHLTSEHGA